MRGIDVRPAKHDGQLWLAMFQGRTQASADKSCGVIRLMPTRSGGRGEQPIGGLGNAQALDVCVENGGGDAARFSTAAMFRMPSGCRP